MSRENKVVIPDPKEVFWKQKVVQARRLQNDLYQRLRNVDEQTKSRVLTIVDPRNPRYRIKGLCGLAERDFLASYGQLPLTEFKELCNQRVAAVAELKKLCDAELEKLCDPKLKKLRDAELEKQRVRKFPTVSGNYITYNASTNVTHHYDAKKDSLTLNTNLLFLDRPGTPAPEKAAVEPVDPSASPHDVATQRGITL